MSGQPKESSRPDFKEKSADENEELLEEISEYFDKINFPEDNRKPTILDKAQSERLVNNIFLALQQFHPDSEGRAKNIIIAALKVALEKIEASKNKPGSKILSKLTSFLKKKPDAKILDKLASFFAGIFELTKKYQCSAKDAWFLWIHANLNRIIFNYETEPSKEGQRLLELTKQAVISANHQVFRGGHMDIQNTKCTVTGEMTEESRRKVTLEFRRIKERDQEFFRKNNMMDELVDDVLAADQARVTGIGNCQERTTIALSDLISVSDSEGGQQSFQAEEFRIRMEGLAGDHIIGVAGRVPNSNPKDFTTWGPDAVVFDSSRKRCYFAREIPKLLDCYVCDKYYAHKPAKGHLEPLHPHRHELQATGVDLVGIKLAEAYLNEKGERKNYKPMVLSKIPSNRMSADSESSTGHATTDSKRAGARPSRDTTSSSTIASNSSSSLTSLTNSSTATAETSVSVGSSLSTPSVSTSNFFYQSPLRISSASATTSSSISAQGSRAPQVILRVINQLQKMIPSFRVNG